MKLSRSQRWKLHQLNRRRVARGLKVISAEAAFMALGENEQKLTSDRNELFPYTDAIGDPSHSLLYNPNYRNNGNIVNLQNPTFEDIERGGYVGSQIERLRKDNINLKIVPFVLNNGDMITILPRNADRQYLSIQSDTTNVNAVTLTSLLFALFRPADDTGNLTIQKDALIISAGQQREFNQKIPVNAISLHYPKAFDVTVNAINTITGVVIWG